MKPIVAVILSGGSGTRLWPLSRKAYPKQFLTLNGEGTMFQQTIRRVQQIEGLSEVIVVANEEHRFIVAEQLRQSGKKGRILLEPEGKNTAPAIAMAAMDVLERYDDAHLIVLSSDHVMDANGIFVDAVEAAVGLSERSMLVTFGIVPTAPETGYGYIQGSESIGERGFRVKRFIEKPPREVAETMLEEGGYYWNSGMFVFRASRIVEELRTHRPDIHEACERTGRTASPDLDFIRYDRERFALIPSESIDYAVMERSENVAVIPYAGKWSDVGSWDALWNISSKDAEGNVFIGKVSAIDTRDSYVRSTSKHVAVAGLEAAVVIVTEDAVLVADKSHAQQVKELVNLLRQSDPDVVEKHQEVHRPWGSYMTLDRADRFQVKRLFVKPGEKLSFQMHYHRAEHWIVVQGTASVVLDEETYILSENQSIHIPLGVKHSLQNPGKIPLEVIEVQSGTYLGEDDIVRFRDEYGRV